MGISGVYRKGWNGWKNEKSGLNSSYNAPKSKHLLSLSSSKNLKVVTEKLRKLSETRLLLQNETHFCSIRNYYKVIKNKGKV